MKTSLPAITETAARKLASIQGDFLALDPAAQLVFIQDLRKRRTHHSDLTPGPRITLKRKAANADDLEKAKVKTPRKARAKKKTSESGQGIQNTPEAEIHKAG